MIAYDNDEAKSSRNVQILKTWKGSNVLENLTGADFLVSPLNLPVHSETLIAKHLQNGACLVQVKRLGDFPSSALETGNLHDMMDRMLTFCKKHHPKARPSQRIILSVGLFYEGKEGCLMIGKHEARGNVKYSQFRGAIERIFERDCVYTNECSGSKGLTNWLLNKEKHLIDNKKNPVKFVIQKPSPIYETVETTDELGMPLQQLVVIRDGRRILNGFRNLGEVRVTAVWEYANQSLGRSLVLLSDPYLLHDKNKPKGVALGIIQDVRDELGLKDGEFFFIGKQGQSPETE